MFWQNDFYGQIRSLPLTVKCPKSPEIRHFFKPYESFRDINTTVSTWLDTSILMSTAPRVRGNKSTGCSSHTYQHKSQNSQPFDMTVFQDSNRFPRLSSFLGMKRSYRSSRRRLEAFCRAQAPTPLKVRPTFAFGLYTTRCEASAQSGLDAFKRS